MDSYLFFFEYNDDLLERVVAQQLLHVTLRRLRDEGGYTTFVDADTYTPCTESSAMHEREASIIAQRIAPVAIKFDLVTAQLGRLSRASNDLSMDNVLPYLHLRNALAPLLSPPRPECGAAAMCDLTTAYLIAGHGETAQSLWTRIPRLDDSHQPAKDLIDAALALSLSPSVHLHLNPRRPPAASPASLALENCAHWVPFARSLFAEGHDAAAAALKSFTDTVTCQKLALRIGQVVALVGMQRCAALRADEQSLERQIADLAKTTRVATSTDALQDAVSTAQSLSARLLCAREARARAVAVLQVVVRHALFPPAPSMRDVLTQHAGLALALSSLVWNHLNPRAKLVESAALTAVPSLLGDILRHSPFDSSGTRRLLLWALLQVSTGTASDPTRVKHVGMWRDGVLLPRVLASRADPGDGASDTGAQKWMQFYAADAELPLSFK